MSTPPSGGNGAPYPPHQPSSYPQQGYGQQGYGSPAGAPRPAGGAGPYPGSGQPYAAPPHAAPPYAGPPQHHAGQPPFGGQQPYPVQGAQGVPGPFGQQYGPQGPAWGAPPPPRRRRTGPVLVLVGVLVAAMGGAVYLAVDLNSSPAAEHRLTLPQQMLDGKWTLQDDRSDQIDPDDPGSRIFRDPTPVVGIYSTGSGSDSGGSGSGGEGDSGGSGGSGGTGGSGADPEVGGGADVEAAWAPMAFEPQAGAGSHLVISGGYGKIRDPDQVRDNVLEGGAEADDAILEIPAREVEVPGSDVTISCQVLSNKSSGGRMPFAMCAWADENTAAGVGEVTVDSVGRDPEDIDLEAAAELTVQVREEMREPIG